MQHFVDKFVPARNQTIIALLDRDDAGKKSAEKVLKTNVDTKQFIQKKLKNITIAMLPLKDGWPTTTFIIEDYFAPDEIESVRAKIMTEYGNNSFSSYPNISKNIKDKLPDECKSFAPDKFLGFVVLFDLIDKIKSGP